MARKTGYYYFRFRLPESTCVRFWDGEVWRFCQDGQETDFQTTHVAEQRFIAPPLEWEHHTYYGDVHDKGILQLRWPRVGDELCDGHQLHYEWDGSKWT
jgi:hypothetical protein